MARLRTTAPLPVYLDESDPPSRRAVVSAALRLFVRKGIGETTVREIAAEAGFTNPVLFKYFAGLDELAAFLFERCYRSFSLQMAAAIQGAESFGARLSAVVGVFLGSMDTDLDAHLFVQENLRRLWPSAAPALRRHSLVRMTGELFELGKAEGVVDVALDTLLLSVALLGTIGQLARSLYFGELRGGRAIDSRAQVERLLRNLIHARR